jgi:HlyD family secretion protein
MLAKAGETAVPSPESAIAILGDLTSLRVRAEVEERDAAKIRVGQKVIVKADAYPDKEFEGKVTSISQSLAAPRIAVRGPRRPNDVEVVEAMVTLDGEVPLLTGMRVDVFFKIETTASAAPEAKAN